MPRTKTTNPLKERSLHLDKDYVYFLQKIKQKLTSAQIRAALAANTEQIRFYWEMGEAILKQQRKKNGGHASLIFCPRTCVNYFLACKVFRSEILSICVASLRFIQRLILRNKLFRNYPGGTLLPSIKEIDSRA